MKNMNEVVESIASQIESGRNVYIVYPLVEESEHLDLENVNKGYEFFKSIFNDAVAMLHGRMKAEEKNEILKNFKLGKYRILISTTVIEVGVDVPDATLMVIMNAERFGLSQLHQLRGRVGRNNIQSYCILVTSDNLSQEGLERIKAMIKYTDGFKLSEIDLKMRGPGDFFGVRQSGIPELKFAKIFEDSHILIKARKDAFNIISEDRNLQLPKHKVLKHGLQKKWKKTLEMIRVG
jgi:ATP-dependent DNA helicase RecG